MIQTELGSRMQFNDLFTEVKRRDESAYDVIADLQHVGFTPSEIGVTTNICDDDVISNGIVTDYALGQLATHLKIGTKYARFLATEDPELLAINLNERAYDTGGNRMLRFLDGDMRAALSDSYRRMSDMVLLNGVWMSIGQNSGWQLHEASFTDRRLHMRLIMPLVTADIKVNDPVSLGIRLTNSEVGAGALAVSLEVMRLACLNGMVVPQKGLRKVHLGRKNDGNLIQLSNRTIQAGDHAIMLEIAETMEHLTNKDNFEAIVGILSETADEELPNPIAATKVLSKMGSLNDKEHEAMLNSFVNGGDTTVWGALNAVTDMSRDMVNYDRKVELEEFAGGIAMGGRDAWAPLLSAKEA